MKFLFAGYLPDDFDPSTMDEAAGQAIHAFNAELESAGAMFFACGLYPSNMTKTLQTQPDGEVVVTDGPYLETKEHVGGLLIIEAASMEEALEWAKKGIKATKMPMELRGIFFQEE